MIGRQHTHRHITRSAVAATALLLAGCEGVFTADFGTETPADPDIAAVRTSLRGLEFERSGGATTKLEFRDGEPVDLMDLADGAPLRLFTDEPLPTGDYTGVRLLFERDAEVTVVDAAGEETAGELATGAFAEVDFTVQEDERSHEALTLVLDLRRSLVLDDASDEYTLTPALRSVPTGEAATIVGSVSFSCPTGTNVTQGGAVYVFKGHDVEPDDLGGAGDEPFATARITSEAGSARPVYAVRFLPPGDYSVAATCRGDEDTPGDDDDLDFRQAVDVVLDSSESARVDLD